MGVPQWMVCEGKSINGCFGGTPIFLGNPHIYTINVQPLNDKATERGTRLGGPGCSSVPRNVADGPWVGLPLGRSLCEVFFFWVTFALVGAPEITVDLDGSIV